MSSIEFYIPQDQYDQLPLFVRQFFPKNEFSVGHLLSQGTKKTNAGRAAGWRGAGLFMAPNDSIGLYNVCGSETQYCKAACLSKGKRMGLARAHKALIARNLYYGFHRQAFRERLVDELASMAWSAKRNWMKACCRLNGTSDIAYESTAEGHFLQALMILFPKIKFYDYTKHFGRMLPGYSAAHGIENYDLTFSHSGTNWKKCLTVLNDKQNVSVVFPKTKILPSKYRGWPVVDGDIDDLTFRHPKGVIIGLRQKKAYRNPGKPGWVERQEVGPFVAEAK